MVVPNVLKIHSHYFKSPLTEQTFLKRLYKHPNFFGGLACLQDAKIPIEKCKSPDLIKQLCNPIYRKRFGFPYYKKPRIMAQEVCSIK